MKLFYCFFLLVFGAALRTSGQNIYPEKFDGCHLSHFCLDCGEPKAAYPADLTAYFREKLPAEATKRLKGLALVQVLVDSAGHPCVLSQVSNLGPQALAQLNLRGLINGMGPWAPAQEKGKPVNASSSLRFAFEGGQAAVTYQRFDFSKQTNLKSVGTVEILNKRQQYPAHPKGAKLEVFTQQNSIVPWDMMRVACPDQNNTVWVGTDNGLVKIEHGRMTLLNASNSGLRTKGDNKVGLLDGAVDAHNNKWFSEGYAAYRYDGTTWTRFDSTSAPLRWITGIHADANGNVYFSGSHGLARYDGTKWSALTAQNSQLPAGMTIGTFVDRKNRLWVSSYKGTVRLHEDAREVFTNGPTPLGSATFTCAAEDADGAIWFGLYDADKSKQHSGLAKYTPDGKWEVFTAANSGYPGNDVLDVAIDQQRRVVWASVNRVGLCRFDGKEWTLFTPENSAVPSTVITDISLDAEGTLWGATHAGLLKLQPR
ncbi:ligand-binding sensor domain-containing protein [Hymenobacter ruricola]|uniref:TonB C-terminal domain-containing protein n=1 Tax=Hymenobacter ruricola TaxID=2791023 RepID=A0ABS0HZM6_9BACT|nr:hypothetical protein [Hymenobacter ruricola]MBF9220149.1 hypothetical protein [Hymenobacter ruricola]